MIRNSVKFVNYKDLKSFTADLKLIYTFVTEEQAYEKLQEVKEKWSDKYASALKNMGNKLGCNLPILPIFRTNQKDNVYNKHNRSIK